ncbi:uncharacterized protein BKA55DRAFT_583197 [Fusarium redolens]|uniref:Uncharacterized protein n=1 Tax=Fusarium redolens TaxID=48865 RepID=A0A9P9G1U3_FUSRE|nr:uncharacterized protein BKA55DRAFT_583197 [Fusarium redolens]KAH7230648.1 hypothetical protein BKA55DRAFT_583197 [Fusarium redolens]
MNKRTNTKMVVCLHSLHIANLRGQGIDCPLTTQPSPWTRATPTYLGKPAQTSPM